MRENTTLQLFPYSFIPTPQKINEIRRADYVKRVGGKKQLKIISDSHNSITKGLAVKMQIKTTEFIFKLSSQENESLITDPP